MGGRGLRNRRQTAAFLAVSLLAIALLAPTGTHAQVYIPPPDDLIELETARYVALGAGLDAAEAELAIVDHPRAIVEAILTRRHAHSA